MKDVNKISSNGFPRLISYFSDKAYYYIVLELLGQSLKDLKEQSPNGKMSLKTVTMIGI